MCVTLIIDLVFHFLNKYQRSTTEYVNSVEHFFRKILFKREVNIVFLH